MKKILLSFLWVLLILGTHAYAQTRTVTGTVTGKDDGQPLPGVTVKVSGTTMGTQTDANGKFSLNVPGSAKTLEFSFIGYSTEKAGIGSGTVNVSLSAAASQLSEVVITSAYGVKQSSRSASSAASVVSGEQLNAIRQTNINDALAGKASGLQVRSQSTAALGRETEVRLRGASGFGSGNGAIYVVDGTIIPSSNDINNDDIESVSVLQGPAAAALFGSQGANGAIVMTTKKGKKNNGVGIELNLGARFDKVYILPDYQNTYSGGAAADLMQYHWKQGDPTEWQALDGKYYPDYSDDSSWGPKMVGQEYIPWYAWAGGTQYSYKTASLTANPNNARDFFNTGVTYNNSVALSKAGDDYNMRLSYGNQNVKGIQPYTNLNKNTFSLNVNYNLNKHFIATANVNYVGTKVNGNISDDYGAQTGTGSFNQWFHRDIDMGIMKELQDLRTADGTYVSWNHLNPTSYDPSNPAAFYGGNYWYNPYTYNKLYNNQNQKDNFYGFLSLTYKLNDHFSVKGTYRRNQTNTWGETKIPSELQYSATQTGLKAYYGTGNSYLNRENYEMLANYNQKFKDFTVDVNLGSDIYNAIYKYNGENTNNGLSVDDLFSIGNSVDAASITNSRYQEQYRALFGTANVGYKNFLFGNATLRKDWFSTVSPVLSKSFGGSFVFSELLPKNITNWLSYGKARFSWGEIPQSLGGGTRFGAYAANTTFGVSQYKWGTNILMSYPDTYVDPSIHGTVTQTTEFGLDLRFLNDRLGITGTYYTGTDRDVPLSVSVNQASGSGAILTNVGLIKRNGIELVLTGQPIRLKNFSWTINATWNRNLKNDIEELSPKYGVTQFAVQSVWGSTMPYMVQTQGKRWGQIYGNGIKRNADGVPILTSAGLYQNDPNVYFGSVLPNYTGGIQNQFNLFKDFTLNVNIDYQVGGKFVSLSQMWGAYSGLTKETAALNDKGNPVRDPVADGGGVHVTGVDANNNPVSYYVDAKTYYQGIYNNKTFDEYVYDLTFIKLRELGLGYRIPVQKLGLGKVIQNATFQLTARDLWLIYAKSKGFDPSQIDALVGETAQYPGTRGIGFNLRVTF